MKPAKLKPKDSMQPFWYTSGTIKQHIARCRTLPPPTETENSRMVEAFLSSGGTITKVSPAFVMPTASVELLGASIRP